MFKHCYTVCQSNFYHQFYTPKLVRIWTSPVGHESNLELQRENEYLRNEVESLRVFFILSLEFS